MKPTRAEIGSMIVTFLFIIAAALVLIGGESRQDGEAFEIKTAKTPPPSSVLSDGGEAATYGKININTATKEDFESLYGIGETLSLAIIEYRDKNGPFSQPEDIMLVPGIGKAKFDDIREYISVN